MIAGFLFTCCAANPASGQVSIEWQCSLGGSALDEGNCIQAIEGGFIVTGWTRSSDGDVSFNHGDKDLWLVRLDGNGGIVWERTYGGSKEDIGLVVRQVPDGGFLVAGGSDSKDGDLAAITPDSVADPSHQAAWILRLDMHGDLLWQFRRPGYAYSNDLALTDDGGFVVVGQMADSLLWEVRPWLMKCDSMGVVQWEQVRPELIKGKYNSVRPSPDGGFILSGQVETDQADIGPPWRAKDLWIVKVDGSGELEWEQIMGGLLHEEGLMAIPTSDGGYLGVGYWNWQPTNLPLQDMDLWVIKLDGSGVVEWDSIYGGDGDDSAMDVHEAVDGSFLITGWTHSAWGDVSFNNGGSDGWLLCIDDGGGILWEKAFGSTVYDRFNSMDMAADGNFVVVGFSGYNDGDVAASHGLRDVWVVKLGPDLLHIDEEGPAVDFLIYPNPVRDLVEIQSTLPDDRHVLLELFDAGGRSFGTLFDGRSGTIPSRWSHSMNGMAPGLYLLRLTIDGQVFSRPITKL